MNTQFDQNESWEKREMQIRLERAEEFAKLNPEEQTKLLEQEKKVFQRDQEEARKKMGFQKYEPGKAEQLREVNSQEEKKDKESELSELEKDLGFSTDQKTESKKEKIDLAKFDQIYKAAIENIKTHKVFQFQSLAVDDHGRLSTHLAKMVSLSDHSQKGGVKPEEIAKRLLNKQANPSQIGLVVEIDMGEDKENHLGLTNISMEIPLASLLDGHFSEKIAKFTNTVLFAATLHQKTQSGLIKTTTSQPGKSQEKKSLGSVDVLKKKSAIRDLGTNKSINSNNYLENGDLSTVTFSCNHGAVWGSFDQHGLPVNQQELQESLDKISIEK
jgi:hypothetical protein